MCEKHIFSDLPTQHVQLLTVESFKFNRQISNIHAKQHDFRLSSQSAQHQHGGCGLQHHGRAEKYPLKTFHVFPPLSLISRKGKKETGLSITLDYVQLWEILFSLQHTDLQVYPLFLLINTAVEVDVLGSHFSNTHRLIHSHLMGACNLKTQLLKYYIKQIFE